MGVYLSAFWCKQTLNNKIVIWRFIHKNTQNNGQNFILFYYNNKDVKNIQTSRLITKVKTIQSKPVHIFCLLLMIPGFSYYLKQNHF